MMGEKITYFTYFTYRTTVAHPLILERHSLILELKGISATKYCGILPLEVGSLPLCGAAITAHRANPFTGPSIEKRISPHHATSSNKIP